MTTTRRPSVTTVVGAGIALVLCLAGPARAQFTLTGGLNGILGIYLSAGRILTVAPGTTLTFGATYSEVLKTEPLISVTAAHPMSRGWTAAVTATMGGLGGDYRVDRLPEVNLAKSQRISQSFLTYGFDFGAGNYMVRPVGINGYRVHAAVQLSTLSIPLGGPFSTSASIGYRQYFYSTSMNGAAWGTVQLTAAPSPGLSATLTYYRQIASGSSTLLFDALGPDNYLSAGFTLRPAQALIVSHSQTYSLISSSITARVYGVSVSLEGGHTVGVSWDDVPGKLTLTYSRSGLGSFSVFWYP